VDIHIKGAREHNLKNLDLEIGDGLTVVTGVSGSGKTSLVFDTLYHEARRRLYNTISTSRSGGWRYQLAPANVETIDGLGPAIAVGQNILNRNPNSTLASASGLHPFLRLLYTNYGVRHCPHCGSSLSVLTQDEIVGQLLYLVEGSSLIILAPLLRAVPGSHRKLLNMLGEQFKPECILIDGSVWASQPLDPLAPHDLDIEVAKLDPGVPAGWVRQIVDLVGALGARAIIARGTNSEQTLASAPVCTVCGWWFGDLEARYFHMDCPYCQGKGCEQCDWTGAHPQAAAVRWQGARLPELLDRTVSQTKELFSQAELPASAGRLLDEINSRLDALERVGLGYITLNRKSPTLSRGESQRVRLSVALTSKLEDILHVLDEPTIGQHPADVARFLPAFRDLAGPVVYVEHDRVAAASADRVIDLGPGAGELGGEIVFSGSPAELWEADTATGNYFGLRESVAAKIPRTEPEQFLIIRGAYKHNLKDIDVAIPLGRMTAITGVSGSGKSTLVEQVLVRSLEDGNPKGCIAIEGEMVKPVLVDQSPIGRNPRSNPATYTKLSDIIRQLFAQVSGLSISHFSFNRPEGACPTCKGMGAVEVKMQFLYSVWIQCADCGGARFNELVLAEFVPFGDRVLNIADFYFLSMQDVAAIFQTEGRLPANRIKTAQRILRALMDVGLGYMPLGQPSPTLSGGEAQRVKLTRYLGRNRLVDRMLVLDEPSTGLHPKDLDGLLIVLDRLVGAGATVVVVEHNADIVRAADWVVDLGVGAGPQGGNLLYAGPFDGLFDVQESVTGRALMGEAKLRPRNKSHAESTTHSDRIRIRNARANNLKGVDVDIPKGKLTVVTGLSGSGKSSLVQDVLEVEARRRYLETLSVYERQGTREGPEAPVESVSGLGVTLSVQGFEVHQWSAISHFSRRASVGRATEISHHLAVLLAESGERTCKDCGESMVRGKEWTCPGCRAAVNIANARHFSTSHYGSACDECTGVGVLYKPQPEKLIICPDKPLCKGAMYSPGYWPQTYLCQDTGFVQALAARYGFDPEITPWNEMSVDAKNAFLYGDDEPLERTYRSKSTARLVTVSDIWQGFYGGWVRDWDIHGTYTRKVTCESCGGAGLKAEYLAVTIAGYNLHQLSEMALDQILQVLENLSPHQHEMPLAAPVLKTAIARLRFLQKVGLGYLNLYRPTGTLSAGEAQRIQLAGLLGSGLTSLTVLLDEPSRGMHPSELEALRDALSELRDEGNTVIVVEHDLLLIQAADYIINLGPEAGVGGGQINAVGSPNEVAASDTVMGKWLRGERKFRSYIPRDDGNPDQPDRWLVIQGARENNLQVERVEIPLGVMVGVCGVSGSGKSTLLLDTLGRALVKKSHTTSFANEPLDAGEHDAITGAPRRVVLVDQSRREIRSPAVFLGLTRPLLKLYASSQDAQALGLDEKALAERCTACKGRGVMRTEMGFLPDIYSTCETCRGTGYLPEAWEVLVKDVPLPEINQLTLDEVYELFHEETKIARNLEIARDVGLGYLVWQQPGHTLSGGESQRLKIVKELARKTPPETLFVLDEPTVGQHMEDICRLIQVLRRLVNNGHTVTLIEHHPHVLASCDWLIELGPGGGPDGGRVIACGTPRSIAGMDTPTAPYLREIIEGKQ